jgi:hypothetical protein
VAADTRNRAATSGAVISIDTIATPMVDNEGYNLDACQCQIEKS